MRQQGSNAPGQPGIKPLWTSSAKCGVGTSAQAESGVWFTLGHGILNEVYCPEVDRAAVRDLGFIVTDGADFFSEEKCDTKQRVEYLADAVPAYRLTNENERYRLEKEIITDPRLDVLLQRVRFVSLREGENLRLYVLLAPRLGNGGAGNTAWIREVWGQQLLFAAHGRDALALACSAPFGQCSAGFVGVSDGWQDLHAHKRLTWEYTRAENGNVALVAEIDLAACGGEFVLALGFDSEPLGAAHHARASLLDGFEAARAEYLRGWQEWQKGLSTPKTGAGRDFNRLSVAVLKIHTGKKFPGGVVASLSIPWGFAKGSADRGGYHLVWVRDLVEAVGGLLAAGASAEAARVLRYLAVTQKADGSWPQNMWVSGKPYWGGEQMDETAFPVLLTAAAQRENLIDQNDLDRLWPMVRSALNYIVRYGPATKQDRWEEVGGYSPFTLAIEICALVEGADLMQEHDASMANYLRETADTWNASIERWTYATGTALAGQCDVPGYYVRISPQRDDGGSPVEGLIPIKNHAPVLHVMASSIVSPDALALVNYGLRAPDDPRMLNTIRVIDALLKTETPHGPCWHRYNRDGYGEHADGAPFDGTGIGRAWPLLTGERAHYELAAGRPNEARRLRQAMEAFAGGGGMIPEQIWDAADIPSRELFFGRPSGSAMPLVWAHAEYVKLSRSLGEGKAYSISPATTQRYLAEKKEAAFCAWRFSDKIQSLPPGKNLRIELLAPASVHWSIDGWKTTHDTAATDSKLGVHFVDVPADHFSPGGELVFTFRWTEGGNWEGKDFRILS